MPRVLGEEEGRRWGAQRSQRPRGTLCLTRLGLWNRLGRPLLPMRGQLSGMNPGPRASGATPDCWAVCWALRGTLPLLLLLLLPTRALPLLLLPLLLLLLPARALLWPSPPRLLVQSPLALLLQLLMLGLPPQSMIQRLMDRSGIRDAPHPSELRLSPCSARLRMRSQAARRRAARDAGQWRPAPRVRKSPRARTHPTVAVRDHP